MCVQVGARWPRACVRCHLSRGSGAMPVGGVGVQAPEASPGRYVRRVDEVPPDDDGCDNVLEADGRCTGDDDPFDIPAKRVPVERLWRWRDGGLYICRWRWILSLLEDQSQSPKLLSKFRKRVLGLPPARYLPSPTSTLPRAAEALSGHIT